MPIGRGRCPRNLPARNGSVADSDFRDGSAMSRSQKTQNDVVAPIAAGAKPAALVDERLRKTSIVTEAMRRPELGAIAGLIVVLIFFLSPPTRRCSRSVG